MARLRVAGFHQFFLAKDDGLFLRDETLQHGSVLPSLGCHSVLRDPFFATFIGIEWLLRDHRNLIVFTIFRGIGWLFRDRRYFMIFTILRGIEWLTGRARVRGRAGRSANAIVVEMMVSKHFSESRFSFSFGGPFEQHVFQRLPSDRLGKVIILHKVKTQRLFPKARFWEV